MLHRRTLLTGVAAGATIPLLGGAPAGAAPAPAGILARKLRIPWGLAFLPNGDALVGERPSGRVHRVRSDGGRRQVGTIAEAVVFGEGGLLGIAVAPTFATDRWVYFYVTTDTDNRVIRRRFVSGALSDHEVVFPGIARSSGGTTLHHGGRLAFGPSGHLFVSTGDAGDSDRSQNNSSPNGKILRLHPDGSIPDDNPVPGNPMWTKGHRNVQGLAWDGQGRMWATEFGQNTTDELNRIVPGANYGWPVVEGGDGPGGAFEDPFVTWQPTSSCSPSGLAIAQGRAWVGALAGEALFSVELGGPDAGRKRRHLHEDFGRIRTVQKAPDRSLWITTSNFGRSGYHNADDRIIRIRL